MKGAPRAWAWEINFGGKGWTLCHWAVPYKADLLKERKPSPEARPVCVRLTRNTMKILGATHKPMD